MPSFEYTARDKSGSSLSGRMDADSKQDLLQKLRNKGLVPTSVNQGGSAKTARGLQKVVATGTAKGKKVKSEEMILFTRSLF